VGCFVDWKIVSWSVVLFFGSWLVFRAIADATSGSSPLVTFGAQAAALAIIIWVVVLVMRKRDRGG
jgi:hypothetical protein